MVYTTDDVLASLKRNGVIPSSQRKFSDDDFLVFINDELQLMVTGELMRLNEEFFVTQVDVPLVANQSLYTFPSKAAGWRIRDIGYVDSNGLFTSLTRIPMEYKDRYNYQPSDHPLFFTIMDSDIHTIPDMGTTVVGSLRIYFERLQNQMVKVDECGQITNVAIVGTDYQCTVNNIPLGYSNGVDFVSGTGPHGLLAEAKVATVGLSTVTVPIGTDFIRVPVIGDWICQTGKTPIAHIPAEYNIILAQLGALRYAESSGDEKSVAVATSALSRMIGKLRERSLNRTKGSPMKINTKNRVLNLMRGRLF